MREFLKDRDGEIAAKAAWFFVHHPDGAFADALLAGFQSGRRVLLGPCARALSKLGDRRFVEHFEQRFKGDPFDVKDPYQFYCALAEQKSKVGIMLLHAMLSEFVKGVEPGTLEERASLPSVVFKVCDALLHARSPEEMRWLVRLCVALPKEELQSALLDAFLANAGAQYDPGELDLERKELRPSDLSPAEKEQLEFLRNQGSSEFAKEARRLFKKEAWTGIIRLLHRDAEAIYALAKSKIGEAAFTAWEARARQPLLNLQLLRAISEETALIAAGGPLLERKMAVVALVVFNCFLDSREFLGRVPGEMKAEQRLGLLLADRLDLPEEDEELTSLLGDEEVIEPVIAACLGQIRRWPESPGSLRAIRLLGKLRRAETAPPLLSVLTQEDAAFVEDVLTEALSQIGEPVLPSLKALLNSASDEEILAVLPLLGLLPYPETVDLITSHYDRLYRIDKRQLMDAIENLGSAAFLPLLKATMREGEPDEAAYLLLGHLHGLRDRELAEIEKRQKRSARETEKKLKRLSSGDRRALISETLTLDLRCQKCRRTYGYNVRNVIVDPNLKKIEKAVQIVDNILCKGCGAIDSYELTSDAWLAITASLVAVVGLAKDGMGDPYEGPVKIGMVMADGKQMGPHKALDYYEKKISKEPLRPDLRVAYGNVLKFVHLDEESRTQFQRAVELEPLAVEALYSLAEFEDRAGNSKKALVLYQQCLERFTQGRFYRLDEEQRDDFRDEVEMRVWELQGELGLWPAPAQANLASIGLPASGREKVGRNDPCPCGSGKKYKKCCLAKEEAHRPAEPPASMLTNEEVALKGRLMAFAAQKRFEQDSARALEIFFSGLQSEHSRPAWQDPEMLEFFEWFFFDYVTDGGGTLAERFLRTDGRLLPVAERLILETLMQSSLRLLEVQEVNPASAEIRVKDLVTGEESVAKDVAGSRQLVKWDLIGSRIVSIQGTVRLSPGILRFQPRERDDLLQYLNGEQTKYQDETGHSSWNAFLKARGYLLYQYAQRRQSDVPRRFVTIEHHEMIFCKALYGVTNYHGALFRLRQESDFREETPASGEAGKTQFVWLKRGKSREAVPPGPPVRNAIVLQASMKTTPLSEGVPTLGTVTVTEGQLLFEATSRERLAAGKQRLEDVLGNYVSFKLDTFESVDAALKAHRESGKKCNDPQPELSPEHDRVISQMLTRYYEQWLTTPIPALEDKTPMEAKDSPEGRRRLETILKDIENLELRKSAGAFPRLDVNALRQKLGMD